MRVLASYRSAWVFSTILLWSLSPHKAVAFGPPATTDSDSTTASPIRSRAEGPKVDDPLPDEARVLLDQALDLERQRNWTSAMEVYDKALERWPSRTEFTHRRRLCETHYRIVRRYQDQSFRDVLLKLPRDRALALYDELLERIELNYVDPVPFEPLVRRGLDNLEVALRDPNFLRTNVGNTSSERIVWLRDNLRRRRATLRVPDRAAAQSQVVAICELAKQAINLGDAAVILEFTYGACDALDDYTSYLTPDKLDDLYAMIDGNFVGLGIELKQEPLGLRIVGVIRGGPASEAGLRVGDQITHIEGRPVKGVSLDEAANQLQGTEGSVVQLTLLRASGSSQTFRLVRRHVEVESVAVARIVDPTNGIGYIQLTGFQKTSTEELEKAIVDLTRKGMRQIVLDLRGNPGGLLNVAVEIAERFIDRGIIVSTRGRAPGQSQVYRASSRAVWKMPLYVLIDHDSASASEILAGALKDHHRAVVVGQRSYGKGSVQSIFSLRSAPAGLKLTTAKFYSPRNRPYSEQGVEPDLQVHIDAKPDASGKVPSMAGLGDPATDPVLDHALRHARSQYNASR